MGEGREKERERNTNVKEKETSAGCLSYMPRPGTKPTPQAYTLTGNPTSDLLLCRTVSKQLSHTSLGMKFRNDTCTWHIISLLKDR